jgi:hypothetical protein
MPPPDAAPRRHPRSRSARAAVAQPTRSIDLRRATVLLAGFGVVLVALALAVLPWYDNSAGSSIVGGTYRDLRDVETLGELYGLRAPLVLRWYFGWLSAALLVALIVAVAATAGPALVRRPARIAAPIHAAASVLTTCWALQNLWHRIGGRCCWGSRCWELRARWACVADER